MKKRFRNAKPLVFRELQRLGQDSRFNACTKNICDGAGQCTHVAVICPNPENPCLLEAVCHPLTGCGVQPKVNPPPPCPHPFTKATVHDGALRRGAVGGSRATAIAFPSRDGRCALRVGVRRAARRRAHPDSSALHALSLSDRRCPVHRVRRGRTALLLDEVQPEGASWYVRGPSAGLDDAVIWFGPAGRERDGKLVARSFADYVDQAIQNAFVVWWPLPDPETGAWITRANARPRAPAVISEGGRVQSAYYSEEGRGIVSALHTVTHAEHSSLRDYGAEYALVTMDEGTTFWSPIQTLKAVSQVDAYEEARTSGDAFWSALDTLPMIARIVEVARAIGPLTSYRGA